MANPWITEGEFFFVSTVKEAVKQADKLLMTLEKVIDLIIYLWDVSIMKGDIAKQMIFRCSFLHFMDFRFFNSIAFV